MATPRIRAAAGLVVVAMALVGCGSKKSDTSTATTVPTTSTTTSTASTTTVAPTDQRQTAVWPALADTTRYTDPAEAARTFAVSYLGFVDPVVGAYRSGDARSGEVPIRPSADGPETTVLVRQLAPDDSWWVLGATTPNIQLDAPTVLATITSPVTLTGRSTAYEANVNVEIRQDGTATPLTSGYVMGGANGEMGPFSKSFTYVAPTGGASGGAVVLKTISAKDGSTAEATVVAVALRK